MEDIVTRLFKKGKLVTPEALDYINSKKLEEVLLSDITETVITKVAIEKASDIRILKNLTSKKKELTAEDFTNFYNIKLEKIREIILQRIQKNFVSINKLDTTRQEVYVVGIVKDIKNKEKTIVELEDVTGTVQVILEKTADIELDALMQTFSHRRIRPLVDISNAYGLGEPPSMEHFKALMTLCQGEDMLLYSSDWPHATFDPLNWVFETPISEEGRKKILAENAKGWFKRLSD